MNFGKWCEEVIKLFLIDSVAVFRSILIIYFDMYKFIDIPE